MSYQRLRLTYRGFASNIIWLADTNYRIDLENDRVRFLAGNDDYDALLAADQVSGEYIVYQLPADCRSSSSEL